MEKVLWVVVRVKDGVKCSIPGSKYTASGIALYLSSVTRESYTLERVA